MPRIYFKTVEQYVEFAEGEEVNVLRMAIRADCDVPWQCASGNCGTDRLVVEEGAENLDPPRRRERARLGDLLDAGYRLACQTYTRGDVTVSWDPDQVGLDDEPGSSRGGRTGWVGSGSSSGSDDN